MIKLQEFHSTTSLQRPPTHGANGSQVFVNACCGLCPGGLFHLGLLMEWKNEDRKKTWLVFGWGWYKCFNYHECAGFATWPKCKITIRKLSNNDLCPLERRKEVISLIQDYSFQHIRGIPGPSDHGTASSYPTKRFALRDHSALQVRPIRKWWDHSSRKR